MLALQRAGKSSVAYSHPRLLGAGWPPTGCTCVGVWVWDWVWVGVLMSVDVYFDVCSLLFLLPSFSLPSPFSSNIPTYHLQSPGVGSRTVSTRQAVYCPPSIVQLSASRRLVQRGLDGFNLCSKRRFYGNLTSRKSRKSRKSRDELALPQYQQQKAGSMLHFASSSRNSKISPSVLLSSILFYPILISMYGCHPISMRWWASKSWDSAEWSPRRERRVRKAW